MTGRKIAWVTPLGPRSDIGAHSAAVARALHRNAPAFGCEAALFVETYGPNYPAPLPVVRLDARGSQDALDLFDVVALNIGNNLNSNGIVNDLALSRGGVIVAHDLVMWDYLAARWRDKGPAANRYLDWLCRGYGEAALETLIRSGRPISDESGPLRAWDSEQRLAFPLIEPFLEKAQAIVVHSRFASEFVANFSDAPRLELFLPTDKKPIPRERETSPDGRVRFAIVGHIFRAKQIRLALEAFAASPLLRDKASLRIAGGAIDFDYIRELVDFVRQAGLIHIVRLEANVTERRLQEIKAATDAFVNLRFPNSEGASGALAEEMACGAPVVVLDSGAFRELPDISVVKIADISTPDALRAALERLTGDERLRERTAWAALELSRRRTADAYAQRFLRFVTETEFRPAQRRTGPFPWLGRRPDGAEPSVLDSVETGPLYAATARLDAKGLAQYLWLSLFKGFGPPDRRAEDIIGRLPRELRPRLVGRLAFFMRAVAAGRPIPRWRAASPVDGEAWALMWIFDRDAFASLCERLGFGAGAANAVSPEAALQNLSRPAAPAWLQAEWRAWPERVRMALEPLAPALPSHAPLAGEALAPALGAGWGQAGPYGVASIARIADLRLRLVDRRPGDVLTLDLRAPRADNRPQTLSLQVAGAPPAEVRIESSDRFVLEFPLDDQQTGDLALRLVVERLVAVPGEPVPVGLFLYGLKLER